MVLNTRPAKLEKEGESSVKEEKRSSGFSESMIKQQKRPVASGADGRPAPPREPVAVVLTGGPCGGKTTALPLLRRRLQARGHPVFCVPETATLLQAGGVDRAGFRDDEDLRVFQDGILDVQLKLEDTFRALARRAPPAAGRRRPVLLLDRGALDPKGYCAPGQWGGMLGRRGTTEGALLGRYDVVVHLTSAAVGAERHYRRSLRVRGEGQGAETIRIESLEDSRRQDGRELASWAAFPRRAVVPNGLPGGWEGKVERAYEELTRNLDEIEAEWEARGKVEHTTNRCPSDQSNLVPGQKRQKIDKAGDIDDTTTTSSPDWTTASGSGTSSSDEDEN